VHKNLWFFVIFFLQYYSRSLPIWFWDFSKKTSFLKRNRWEHIFMSFFSSSFWMFIGQHWGTVLQFGIVNSSGFAGMRSRSYPATLDYSKMLPLAKTQTPPSRFILIESHACTNVKLCKHMLGHLVPLEIFRPESTWGCPSRPRSVVIRQASSRRGKVEKKRERVAGKEENRCER